MEGSGVVVAAVGDSPSSAFRFLGSLSDISHSSTDRLGQIMCTSNPVSSCFRHRGCNASMTFLVKSFYYQPGNSMIIGQEGWVPGFVRD